MKKIFFMLLFFISVLHCFAEENLQASESDEILPLSSRLSLSLFGFDGGFPVWEQTSFKLTPYSDFKDKPPSFFAATSPGIPVLLILGALVMGVAGVVEMGNSEVNGLGLIAGALCVDVVAFVWWGAD